MEFYSQYGQDKFVYTNYFANKSNGYFVDIGAHDGEAGSNSLFFERLGWRGVCFEPIPSVFHKLDQIRTCDKRQIAISDKQGTAEFFVLKGYSEALSGLVGYYPDQHIARINRELQEHEQEFEYITVQTSTFNEAITETVIDFLSIDTEGSELSILKSIDFGKYDIKVITVEANYGPYELDQFLHPLGYENVQSLGCDCVYVKKDLLK
jgi:FkbM family methyltransferase